MKALAEAEHSAVPNAVARRTGRLAVTGDSATEDIAVRTMRIERRDFDKLAYMPSNWENEVEGAELNGDRFAEDFGELPCVDWR